MNARSIHRRMLSLMEHSGPISDRHAATAILTLPATLHAPEWAPEGDGWIVQNDGHLWTRPHTANTYEVVLAGYVQSLPLEDVVARAVVPADVICEDGSYRDKPSRLRKDAITLEWEPLTGHPAHAYQQWMEAIRNRVKPSPFAQAELYRYDHGALVDPRGRYTAYIRVDSRSDAHSGTHRIISCDRCQWDMDGDRVWHAAKHLARVLDDFPGAHLRFIAGDVYRAGM
ncbi:hypothetical protein ACWDRB_47360 [Nonomuraea sp. NPDC003707]